MIGVISDIHGNYPALVSVFAELDRLGCDQVYSLGDVAGYHCMINECIDLLRERSIVHVMGNHDYYLVGNLPCPRSESATACLQYQRKTVSENNLDWLRQSRTSFCVDQVSMVHGGWIDPLDEYLYEIDECYFESLPGTVFLSGHTHVQTLSRFSEKVYCNPGSVGQPRDGNRRAAFALVRGGCISLMRIDYDIDAIASEMRKNGFDQRFYGNLYHGTKIGGGISTVRENKPELAID
jgi:putative phosphoesterase